MVHNRAPTSFFCAGGCLSCLIFMFLTNDANKSSLSSLFSDGQNLWNGAEVQIRSLWFMAEFEDSHQDDVDELKMISTLLLSRPEHVLDLVQQGVKILSVYLMIPLPSFEGGGWDMARLTEFREAVEPEAPGMKAKIYSTANNRHFVESKFGTTFDQLKDGELLFRCPTLTTALDSA